MAGSCVYLSEALLGAVTDTEFKILAVLAPFGRRVRIGYGALAKRVGVCRRTVIDALRRLEGMGYLHHYRAVRDGQNQVNTYLLTLPRDGWILSLPKEAVLRLRPLSLLVYAYLLSCASYVGLKVSYPSIHQAARELGMHRNTVRKAITELESAGWLDVHSRRYRATSAKRSHSFFLRITAKGADAARRRRSPLRQRGKRKRRLRRYRRTPPLIGILRQIRRKSYAVIAFFVMLHPPDSS